MNLKKNIRTLTLALVAAFIATAVLAPPATAQASTLQFGTPSTSYEQGDANAIVPDTGRAKVTFDWSYNIANPAFGQVGVAERQTLLTFSTKSCENAALKVTGANSYPVQLAESNGAPKSSDSGTATFFVTATQAAPGETPLTCTFTGKVQGVANQVQDSNDDTANPQVVVRYLGLVSATIPTTIKQAGPQKQIDYQFEVSNLGNSLSNVRFILRDAEAASAGGWNPVAPIPVVLQSTQQGGTDTVKSVSFLVSTPFKNGWNNAEKTFTVDITPESTKDPEKKGSAVTVNVLARVRGVYVPTLEPMIMVGAVIGTALVARLMRGDEE